MATIVDCVRAELVSVQAKVQAAIALVESGVNNLNEDQAAAVAQALDDLDNQVVDSIHNALALLGAPVPAPVIPVRVTTAPTVTVTAVEGAVSDAAAKIEGEIEALKTEADAALAGETKPAASETTQAEPETKPAA